MQRRALALVLDSSAAACLIAGTAVLIALTNTRTFGATGIFVGMVAVTVPVLGLAYVAGRRISAADQPGASRAATRQAPPRSQAERWRRLGTWLVGLFLWFSGLNMVLLPGNIVLLLNQWLDRSPPVQEPYVIEAKTWARKSKRAYFMLQRPDSRVVHGQESVPISRALYDRIVLKRSKVVLTMHDGAFGYPWMEQGDVEWSELAP